MARYPKRDYYSNLVTFKAFCHYKAHEGECQFCHFDHSVNTLLDGSNAWCMVWRNLYPYKHTADHFVIAPRSHVTNPRDLSQRERLAIWDCVEWLNNEFKVGGAGFCLRWGDPKLVGNSIEHIHGHVIVPNGKGPRVFHLSKSSKMRRDALRRADEFERRYAAGERE